MTEPRPGGRRPPRALRPPERRPGPADPETAGGPGRAAWLRRQRWLAGCLHYASANDAYLHGGQVPPWPDLVRLAVQYGRHAPGDLAGGGPARAAEFEALAKLTVAELFAR